MNRKVMARIINSDSDGRFAGGVDLLEADDGGTAVEILRSEIDAGRKVDFVLMDFVMVIHSYLPTYLNFTLETIFVITRLR